MGAGVVTSTVEVVALVTLPDPPAEAVRDRKPSSDDVQWLWTLIASTPFSKKFIKKRNLCFLSNNKKSILVCTVVCVAIFCMCHFDSNIVSTFCVCHHGFGMTVPLFGIHLDQLCVYKLLYTDVWDVSKCCFKLFGTCAYNAICNSLSFEYSILVHFELPIQLLCSSFCGKSRSFTSIQFLRLALVGICCPFHLQLCSISCSP